jgi:hypothetical protein
VDIQIAKNDVRGGTDPGAEAPGAEVSYLETVDDDESWLRAKVSILIDTDTVIGAAVTRDHDVLSGIRTSF